MDHLYHYTTKHGLEGIIRLGAILLGRIFTNPERGVNLTTDEAPMGHGLPDGREVTKEQAKRFNYPPIVKDNRLYCADHTEFRLRISAKNLDLVQAKKYHRKDEYIALAITALFPMGDANDCSDEELKKLRKSPKILLKADTWWYARNVIPIEEILAVGVKSEALGYQELSLSEYREREGL